MKRMCRAVVLLAVLLPATRSSADVFDVAKPQFSMQVSDDGQYRAIGPAVAGSISRKTLEQGRLFFSMTLIARDSAMQYVSAKGFLDAYAVIFCNGLRRDTVSFGITQQRWFEIGRALSQKYDNDGFFSFRTFMYTQQTECSSVEILVRDGGGNTVGRLAVKVTP